MFSSIGSVVEWGKRFGLYSNPKDTEAIARSVDDSGGLCLVPCFDGIQAPYNDSKSTASLIGLSHGTSQAHIVRAMLESFADIARVYTILVYFTRFFSEKYIQVHTRMK